MTGRRVDLRSAAVIAMSPCYSCGEEQPKGECRESRRPCGHHCNCAWVQDICHWCHEEFGEVGGVSV